MLAERGIDVSYETVRRWASKFGTIIARKLSYADMALSDSRSVNRFHHGSLVCKIPINVTVPSNMVLSPASPTGKGDQATMEILEKLARTRRGRREENHRSTTSE